ncbi:HemK2/MTQ2 family protein methyltransferase [Halococcus thailandensis]|uniref:Methyltransferase n=1 Tax=Halococcus thailandensis JCM 13552 TaxID=1227457 RepID=M0MVD6_9EURY|nr:HemK2/MTQ2 family protein methyltransferase [Halococcus thailandensis]EMA49712.1 methyltransferase [Halococcus thailandensis JCM 13552]
MGLDERREREKVYQPAEDSHLLATAARDEVTPADRALDVGTGSGYVATAMAETGATVYGVDPNPHACRQARESGIRVVRGDLTEPFGEDVFDLVTFNPPYLPTTPEEAVDDWMEVALAGGESGRAVIEPFLTGVGRVLSPEGRVLMLVSSLSGFDTVVELANEAGFTATTVDQDSFPFETLSILRLDRE